MGVGVILLILGAILAFAVRGDTSAVDVQVVGLILMIAGAAIIYFVRRGATTEREVTTIHDRQDPDRPVQTVHETVTERDMPGHEHPSPGGLPGQ